MSSSVEALVEQVRQYNTVVENAARERGVELHQPLDLMKVIVPAAVVLIPSFIAYAIFGEVAFAIVFVVLMVAYGGNRIARATGFIPEKPTTTVQSLADILRPQFDELIRLPLVEHAFPGMCRVGQDDAGGGPRESGLFHPKKPVAVGELDIHGECCDRQCRLMAVRGTPIGTGGARSGYLLHVTDWADTDTVVEIVPDHWQRYFGAWYNRVFKGKSSTGEPIVEVGDPLFEEFFLCYAAAPDSMQRVFDRVGKALLDLRIRLGDDCLLRVAGGSLWLFWQWNKPVLPVFSVNTVDEELFTECATNLRELAADLRSILEPSSAAKGGVVAGRKRLSPSGSSQKCSS